MESNLKKLPVAKRSVFEDNLTSFKDESTPTKLHSVAASSLSSLTIDDDDDYELLNKLVLNKDKQNPTEEAIINNSRQEPIGESVALANFPVGPAKETESISQQDEDFNDEETDELTELTPYEEQLLDQYIRRGIAKWTKQNVNEIKPFSWDTGLTCRATRAMLTSLIRYSTSRDFQNNFVAMQNSYERHGTVNNTTKLERNAENGSCESYPNEDSDSSELEDRFNENSYYVTYEEHLLDECIRRGMARLTRRNYDDIRPFSWDADRICLTTRAMMIRSCNENIHGNH